LSALSTLQQDESFELLSLFVRVRSLSFIFVVICGPSPASAVNDRFFDVFADVLERTSSFAEGIIAGDINVNTDDTTSNKHTARLIALRDSFFWIVLARQTTLDN